MIGTINNIDSTFSAILGNGIASDWPHPVVPLIPVQNSIVI
jgi:hypothetical protein